MVNNAANQYDFSTIKLLKMRDNGHGELPFFARIYDNFAVTKELHGHEYMQINYIYHGSCQHVYGESNLAYEVKEGDMFVVPPFVPHRIIPENGSLLNVIEIEFNPELVTQELSVSERNSLLMNFLFLEPYLMSSEHIIGPQLNFTGVVRKRLEGIMFEIIREFHERDKGFEVMIKSLISNLVIKIGRTYQANFNSMQSNHVVQRHNELIQNAIKYIEDNCHEKLYAEDVAKIATLSTSYFCYVFKNITHKTFTEFVNELRIKKSMKLLKTTDLSIGEICFTVGFNNISHFNRLFKNYATLSPSAFRKKY